MDHAEGGVAVAFGVDEDPDADQVVNVGELAAADHHLLVDRVVVLGPAGDHRLDAALAQIGLDPVDDLAEVGVARGGALGDQPDDLVVALGVEGAEGQVLEFPLHGVHAQAVRQRGENLERLARLALLLGRRQEPQRAHVVQPVGELDDQHPGVAGHGDDHLAHRLGLGGLAEFDLVQLGDAVDEVGYLLTELGGDVGDRVPGVLDGVVQQGGDQRCGVHAQLGEDGGDGERVGDVRVAGLAQLAVVPVLGDVIAALQQPRRPPSGGRAGAPRAAVRAPAGSSNCGTGRSCAGPGGPGPGGGAGWKPARARWAVLTQRPVRAWQIGPCRRVPERLPARPRPAWLVSRSANAPSAVLGPLVSLRTMRT